MRSLAPSAPSSTISPITLMIKMSRRKSRCQSSIVQQSIVCRRQRWFRFHFRQGIATRVIFTFMPPRVPRGHLVHGWRECVSAAVCGTHCAHLKSTWSSFLPVPLATPPLPQKNTHPSDSVPSLSLQCNKLNVSESGIASAYRCPDRASCRMPIRKRVSF